MELGIELWYLPPTRRHGTIALGPFRDAKHQGLPIRTHERLRALPATVPDSSRQTRDRIKDKCLSMLSA